MKLTVSILLFLISTCSTAQNLLVNGSFEEENICTEFTKNCAPEGWINSQDVIYTDYFINSRLAFDGTHYFGVEAGHARWLTDRTFIRSQLLCQLRQAHKYRIEFYLKSRDNLLDSVGVYFTSYDFLFEKEPVSSLSASLYVADAGQQTIKNDTSWQKISLLYTATGTENYITIGNFSKRVLPPPVTKNMRYTPILIFIDKVSMYPVDSTELLCRDWQKSKQDIYDFNIRHNYLKRYISSHENDIPPPPELSKTSVLIIDTLLLPDILFESGKSILAGKSHGLINAFCSRLTGKQIDSLVVEGHTDNTGSLVLNQKLSKDRAGAVIKYITEVNRLHAGAIISRSWDSQKPIADNRSPGGRQQNRRVEIFVYTRE